MNVIRGRYFEKLAAEHLAKLGHQIIVRNFYTWCGEIDLITIYQNKIRFIEIKYLHSTKILMPVEKVNLAKIRRIFFGISYLKQFCKFKSYQVDVVSIYFKNNKINFEYLENLRMV